LCSKSASALRKNAINRQFVNDWFQVSAKTVRVYMLWYIWHSTSYC